MALATRYLSRDVLEPYLGIPTVAPTLIGQAYTTSADDLGSVLAVTAGGSTATITLLSAVTAGDGAVQIVTKADAGAGRVVVTDGANDLAWLSTLRDNVTLRSNGLIWFAVNWKIQSFTTVYPASVLWVKPPLLSRVNVKGCPGAGGGGSGPQRPSGAEGGGGGGACAPWGDASFLASELGATEQITIGTGGLGGLAVATAGTNGNPGSVGTAASFGTHWKLPGAAGGGAGGTAGGSAGANGSIYSNINNSTTAGAAGSITATPGAGNAQWSGSGGAGGGITAAGATLSGSDGGQGSLQSNSTIPGGLGATVDGAAGQNGNSITSSVDQTGGSGAGGGKSNLTGPGGDGGNGGWPGGGGSGGAASRDGFPSGKGGKGADGVLLVTHVF